MPGLLQVSAQLMKVTGAVSLQFTLLAASSGLDCVSYCV